VPSEIPPTVGAYKSQQRRWACGSIQCARKHLASDWRSDRLSVRAKMDATLHLCGYGVCLGCAVPKAGGGYALVCRDGPVFASDAVEWAGLP